MSTNTKKVLAGIVGGLIVVVVFLIWKRRASAATKVTRADKDTAGTQKQAPKGEVEWGDIKTTRGGKVTVWEQDVGAGYTVKGSAN